MFALFENADNFGSRSEPTTVKPEVICVNDPFANKNKKPIKVVEVDDDEPEQNKKTRVMLCGTYPVGQSNGYSRVVYYIAKYLGLKDDILLTIYGFQNFKQTLGSSMRNDIPSSVILHDALATEKPQRNGFGEKEIGKYLKTHPQDIVIIFNDMVITSALTQTIVEELTPQEREKFLLVSYMDQVYPYQKQQYLDILNQCFNAVITFTPYWETIARQIGLKKEIPTYVFPHGFDHKLYFPVAKKVARIFFNLPEEAFIVLNLNRNQPLKRWDHTMMVWAKVVKKHIDAKKANPQKSWKPMKLIIATMVDGFWNLLEIYESELRKYGITKEEGKEYIISIAKPQQLSDRDINIMYSACDIGLNTCEGEGFGLCQFEHAAVGCPQVCPNIGGFKEYFHSKNAMLVEPKWNYYVDKQRDGIGGYAEIGDLNDYVEGIWKYYTNPGLMQRHGATCRKEILQHYRWETMVDHFHSILQKLAATRTPPSL